MPGRFSPVRAASPRLFRSAPLQTGVIYGDDPGTLNLALTPDATESVDYADSALVANYLDISQSAPDFAQFTEAATAVVGLVASAGESADLVEAATVGLVFGSSAVEQIEHSDANTLSIGLTPDVSEFKAVEYSDSAVTGLTFTPDSSEIYFQAPDAATVAIKFTPSVAAQKEITNYRDGAPTISALFDNEDVNSSSGRTSLTNCIVQKFTAPANGTPAVVSSVLNTSSQAIADTIKIEIRADNGTYPGSVIAQTADIPASQLPLSPNKNPIQFLFASTTPLVSGTSYWICWHLTSHPASGNILLYEKSTGVSGTGKAKSWVIGNTSVSPSSTDDYFEIRYLEGTIYDGLLTLSPSGAESADLTDSATVSIGLTASGGDVYTPPAIVYTDSATAAIGLTPSVGDVSGFVDASTVIMTMGPSSSEVLASTDLLAVGLLLNASAAETREITDSGTIGLIFTPSPFGAYPSTVLGTTGLVGYWRLGEGSGTSAADSKQTNNGTYNGGFTLSQPGALEGDANTAVALDGSTGYVNVPNNTNMNVGDVFTLEAWVKRGVVGSNRTIMSKQANAYVFWFETDRLTLRKSGAVDSVQATVTTLDTTSWHHCVAVKNGAVAKVYLDGVDVSGVVTPQTFADNTSALTIGQSGGQFWNGLLDEVAIYNRDLTAAEVLQHYNLGRPEILQAADSGTTTVSLTPSSAEIYSGAVAYTDATTTRVVLTPSVVETREITDSAIESFKLTPSVVDVSGFTDASTTSLGLSILAAAEVLASVDSLTSNVILTPSAVELIERTGVDAATAALSFSPSGTDAPVRVDADTAPVGLFVSSTDVAVSADIGVTSLSFLPSVVEVPVHADVSVASVLFTPDGVEFVYAAIAYTDSATAVVLFEPFGGDAFVPVHVVAEFTARFPSKNRYGSLAVGRFKANNGEHAHARFSTRWSVR